MFVRYNFTNATTAVPTTQPPWLQSRKLPATHRATPDAIAEGLPRHLATNQSGYSGVSVTLSLCKPGQPKPYRAQQARPGGQQVHGGQQVRLGNLAPAEEAVLRVARSPEGHAAPPALKREEALQQARVERLTLRVVETEEDGPPQRVPQAVPQVHALLGAGVEQWQETQPGPLRHRRGGCAVRRAIARGANTCGDEGCSTVTGDEALRQAQAEGLKSCTRSSLRTPTSSDTWPTPWPCSSWASRRAPCNALCNALCTALCNAL